MPCSAASARSVARATSGRTGSTCSAVISESRPNRAWKRPGRRAPPAASRRRASPRPRAARRAGRPSRRSTLRLYLTAETLGACMEALPEEGSPGMTTIARVAALAGVGVGTVSRVLNDSGAVSPGTRRRVQEAIDALDYEPNAAARALSTGRTLALGVVAPFATRALGRRAAARRRAPHLRVGVPARPPRRRPARSISRGRSGSVAVKAASTASWSSPFPSQRARSRACARPASRWS